MQYIAYRYDKFAPGEIYITFTRGVEKRDVFLDDVDRKRFLDLLVHYLPENQPRSFSVARKLKLELSPTSEGKGLVDLLCYCLMSNHFHLLIKENVEHGISRYMHRLLTGYAKYFNTKRERSGSLFTNPFKAVLVDGDEQFTHVSRYIHRNPVEADIVTDLSAYQWSSLSQYTTRQRQTYCHTDLLRSVFSAKQYQDFVEDEDDYYETLAENEGLLIDFDD